MHRFNVRGRRGILALLSAVTLMTTGLLSAADASAGSLQQQIDQQLAKIPGGVQVSDNAVAYKNGTVVIVFPSPGERTAPVGLGSNVRPTASKLSSLSPQALTSDLYGCPYGASARWYCFYTNENFGGRRLQFQDTTQDLASNWGFDNQTTSWVNTNSYIHIYAFAGGYTYPLWTEGYGMTASANVGDAFNDAMSSWTAHH